MVRQAWFQAALDDDRPVDLYLLIGHNIARPSTPGSTWQAVHAAIRARRPDTPIQILGGHSHVRDFAVLDDRTTALESGRYCETVGWLAVSGFDASNNAAYRGPVPNPPGVPNPSRRPSPSTTRPARPRRPSCTPAATWTGTASPSPSTARLPTTAPWTRPPACGPQADIASVRLRQRLGTVYGCAPGPSARFACPRAMRPTSTRCWPTPLGFAVVNPDRADRARLVLANRDGVRFDLHKVPSPPTTPSSFHPCATPSCSCPTCPTPWPAASWTGVFLSLPLSRPLSLPLASLPLCSPVFGRNTANIVPESCRAGSTTRRRTRLETRAASRPCAPSGHVCRRGLPGHTPRGSFRGPSPGRRHGGYVTKDDFGTDVRNQPGAPPWHLLSISELI